MDIQQNQISTGKASRRVIVTWLFVGGLLIVSVLFFLKTDFFQNLPGTLQQSDDSFSKNSLFADIKREYPTFEEGMSQVKANDVESARSIFNGILSKAESEKKDDVVGVIKLWLAMTYGRESENNQESIKLYTQQLIDIATNDSYHLRTRSFAYSFLGELYSRKPAIDIVDIILNDSHFTQYIKRDSSGTVLRNDSFIEILKGNTSIYNNSVLYARTASLMSAGLSRKSAGSDRDATVTQIVEYLNLATKHEESLKAEDTRSLYTEYLFLVAQTVMRVLEVDHRVYQDRVTINPVEYFNRTLEDSKLGNWGIQASTRYHYASYLISDAEYVSKSNNLPLDSEELTIEIENLMAPFSTNEALRETAQFGVIVGRGSLKTNEFSWNIAKYSPSFAELLTENGVLP